MKKRVIFSIVSALLIALTIISGYRYSRAVVTAADADTLDRSTRSLMIALLDAETGQRGYIITGDEGYLAPYSAGISVVHDRLADLVLTGKNSEPKRVDAIINLTSNKLNELAYTIQLRRSKGFAASSEEVDKHIGRNLMNEIRKQIDQIQINQIEKVDAAADNAVWYARGTFIFFLLSVLSTFPLIWLARQR